MDACRTPRLKVCCIASPEEARLAIAHGASALGLVSEMPSGPGVIGEERIAEIAAAVPPPVASFLLTCRLDAASLVLQQRRCRASALQLCDLLDEAVYAELRAELPGVKLVQVVHVTGRESIDEAQEAAAHVDAILLDSGNRFLPIKELGGTGRVHDWSISREIRERLDRPVFLAGGLNPGNVAEAVRAVGPFGLDVCSGVRSNGRLDAGKLAAFAVAMRG